MFYTNRNQHTTSASAHAAEAAFSCTGSMNNSAACAAAMPCNSIVSILDAIMASIFVTLIALITITLITLSLTITLITILVLLALVLVVLLHHRPHRNRS